METQSWQQAYRESLCSAQDLLNEGFIGEQEVEAYTYLLRRFQFRLTRYYAALIDRNDPHCPIRRQAIPSLEEFAPGGVADPLQDLNHQPTSRITHRYPNRVLWHLTPNCSMYCRYCFRKTLLNELKGDLFGQGLAEGLDYLRGHPEVKEVILSGGDPLMLSDTALREVLVALNHIPHLRRIRFHTRIPVTFPERIEEGLLQALSQSDLPLVLVTHFNHPKELSEGAAQGITNLQKVCHLLLNQSVLLKGVNDNANALCDLQEGLFSMEVVPYYLHHPDPALGTQHFQLTRDQGLALYHQIRSRLPGYLVPRYVTDRVGAPYKEEVV